MTVAVRLLFAPTRFITLEKIMLALATIPVLATVPILVGAIGYSILYLLLGGGLGGAVLIFIAAKILRR